MSPRLLTPEPLSATAFAPFGQVIEPDASREVLINAGRTQRFHDLADIQARGPGARVIVSIFRGQPVALPCRLAMVERHPLGSQAFVPLSARPFLVIVAPDDDGTPGRPRVFRTAPHQGVNIAINTWHGVLTPLEAISDFLVVDRGGEGSNLEEHHFTEPFEVAAA